MRPAARSWVTVLGDSKIKIIELEFYFIYYL